MQGSILNKRNGQALLLISLSFRPSQVWCLHHDCLKTRIWNRHRWMTSHLSHGQTIRTSTTCSSTSPMKQCRESHSLCWTRSSLSVKRGTVMRLWGTSGQCSPVTIECQTTMGRACKQTQLWTQRTTFRGSLISSSSCSASSASTHLEITFKIIKILNGLARKKGGSSRSNGSEIRNEKHTQKCQLMICSKVI